MDLHLTPKTIKDPNYRLRNDFETDTFQRGWSVRDAEAYLEEMNQFRTQLTKDKLKIIEMKADGNSLFRAISDQEMGDPFQHMFFRGKTVDYMMEHKELFEPLIPSSFKDVEEYCAHIGKEGVWGGDLELYALANLMKFNVMIH